MLKFKHKHKGKHKYDYEEYASKLKAKLQAIQDNIDDAIQAEPEVLARLSIPLQVDNDFAAPLHYSSNFSGHKLSLTIPLGSPIDGETTEVSASITNLSHLNFKFPELDVSEKDPDDDDLEEDENFKYQASLYLDDLELINLDLQNLSFGQTHTEKREIGPLSAFAANKLVFSLDKSLHDKKKHDRKMRKWGALELAIPVSTDSVLPVISQLLPGESFRYAQNMAPFSAVIADEFGRLDTTTFSLQAQGLLLDSSTQNLDLTNRLNLTNLDQTRSFDVNAELNPLVEGDWTFTLSGSDYAGNQAVATQITRIDRTAPIIALGLADNTLTNQPAYILPVTVQDDSPVIVRVLHNGNQVLQTEETIFDLSVTLEEGINTFEVQVVDAAGNIASPSRLNNVELDTIPPELQELYPNQGNIVALLQFVLSGTPTEKLSVYQVNGQNFSYDQVGNKVSIVLTAENEGPFSINITIADLANNIKTYSYDIEVALRPLRPELISIVPNPDNLEKLFVIGTVGSTIPNNPLKLEAGFFKTYNILSDERGAFTQEIDLVRQVGLEATHPLTNVTESASIIYEYNTTFSGLIRDIDDQPMAGVKVSISSANIEVMTNGEGVFEFVNPPTGDQKIEIDATGVSEIRNGNVVKFYAKTNVALNIGTLQRNVLDHPIYLAPLLFDGTETEVVAGSDTTVSSPHAPGVELFIPANAAVFPDGETTGLINIIEIPASRSTVPAFAGAVPDTLYAMEPSGAQFNESVQVILPNKNELPEGMQVPLMVMNSIKGTWELGGLGRVDAGGQTITSEEGMGLRHFSLVYAGAIAPKISTLAANDRPQADVMDGGLKLSLGLPSFKIMGSNVSTQMNYNSNWASPNMLVTNMFDIPDQRIDATYSQEAGLYLIKSVETNYNYKTRIEPSYIEAQFFSGTKASEPMRFEGAPNKSVISYAMDFSDTPSGLYPYSSKYKIKLRRLTMSTYTYEATNLFKSTTYRSTFRESRELDKIYAQDISGPLYLKNLGNSEYGRGWDLNLGAKILNPKASRLLIDEESGAMSSYVASGKIETIYHDTATNLYGVSLNWPNAIFSHGKDIFNKDLSNSESAASKFADVYRYTGALGVHKAFRGGCCGHYFSFLQSFTLDVIPNQFLQNPATGEFFYSSSNGAIYSLNATTSEKLQTVSALPIPGYISDALPWTANPLCYYGQPGLACSGIWEAASWWATHEGCCAAPNLTYGTWPKVGFGDGELGLASFNNAQGITSSPFGGAVVVADTGNNRVRLLDKTGGQVTTIAGNGQNYDLGDGGAATEASLYHPLDVEYDSDGSLYVSTENGYIRKVSSTGYISTYAGKRVENGGVFADEGNAEDMFFDRPSSILIDRANRLMYIADTGNHRIMRIDMNTKQTNLVAGSGNCAGGISSPGNIIGDEASPFNASLCSPKALALDDSGNLVFFDSGHQRIRRISQNQAIGGTLAYEAVNQDGSKINTKIDGSYERTFRNGTIQIFNVEGLLTHAYDRIGRQTTYEYENGKLIRVLPPVGEAITLNYFGDKLTSVIDPAGRETFFNYLGNDLDNVIFPDGSSVSYLYNSEGRIIQEVNQRGVANNYTYNEYGRLHKVIRPDNSEIIVNDALSATAGNSYTGGASGTLINVNDFAFFDSIKDPKGNETKLNKDENGYVSSITDSSGRHTKIERDLVGRPVKITRPDNTVTEFVYAESTGDLISKTDNGLTTTYQFNSQGDLLRQENSFNQWIQNIYEGATGLLLSSTNHAGQTTSATYTVDGMVSTRSNAIGATSSFGYGLNLNLVSVTDALNNVTTYERDTAGNVVKTTNAKGQFTQNSFDLFNRLLRVTDARGNSTYYEYLTNGQLAKVTDPLGNQTSFLYNNLGQMVEKTNPLGLKTTLSYDLNGNVLSELDPNGNLKAFEYNARDELVKKALPDNTYEMTYDSYGKLESISNKNSAIEFAYARIAEDFKVEEETWIGRGELLGMGSHVLSHDYNSLGLVTNTFTLVGNYSRVYDNANRLSALLNPFNEEFQFDFDLANRLKKISRPGSVTHNVFDATNFLTEIRHENLSGAVIGKFEYARDAIGNRTAMRSPAGENQFNYDPDQQVTSSVGPDVGLENFQYDELGNRTKDQGGAYIYDEKRQRLKEDYRFFYYYDNNGNLTSKITKDLAKTQNYHYSSENQLIKIEWFENNVLLKEARYSFDALGRRMQKVVIDHQNSTEKTRRFAYNGQEIIAQLDENNTVLAAYTPSGLRTDDTLSVKVTSAGVAAGLATEETNLAYLKDGLGSITHLANYSGLVKERYLYSAFGTLRQILDESGVVTNSPHLEPFHAYTNRELDNESGLYFFRARVYDSSLGRFLQTDPHPGASSRPLTINNRYIYSNNSPMNYIDPNGRFSFKQFLFILVVSVAAAYTGGAAGAWAVSQLGITSLVGGAIVGAAAGAIAGAVTGALVGGAFNAIAGDSFSKGFKQGAIIGAIAGGIAGARSGYNSARAAQSSKGRYLAQADSRERRIIDQYEEEWYDTVTSGQDSNPNLTPEVESLYYDNYQNTIDNCIVGAGCSPTIVEPPQTVPFYGR